MQMYNSFLSLTNAFMSAIKPYMSAFNPLFMFTLLISLCVSIYKSHIEFQT